MIGLRQRGLTGVPESHSTQGQFRLSLLVLPLVLVVAGCSREEDLSAANRSLNSYLAAPLPGEPFARFLESWEEVARRESLDTELVRRRATADRPEKEAAVLLTQALANLEEGRKPLARESFNLLAVHPGFSPLLAGLAPRHGDDFVPELVQAVADAYLEPNPPEDSEPPFEWGNAGWQVLSVIADTPRCLWALQADLRERAWAEDDLADQFLRRMTAYSGVRQPERVASFVLSSPLGADPSDFDPVEVSDRERPTLFEVLAYYFGRAGRTPSDQLAKYLRVSAGHGFGSLLLAAQFGDQTEAAGRSARLFQEHLSEIDSLPREQRDRIAALAGRLTTSLAGPDLDPGGQLAAFHEWLGKEGQASPGTDLASTWLAATSWEDLPGSAEDEKEVQLRIDEMLPTLVARDPDIAQRLLIHVNRLHRESIAPQIYANRNTTLAENSLYRFVFDHKTPESRAFALNTFEAAKGELGYGMYYAIDEWISWDLSNALYARKMLEDRYRDFFERIRNLASLLELEEPRLLIGPLLDFSAKLPINDVSIPDIVARVEAKQAEADPDSMEAALLKQLRIAIWMHVQHQLVEKQGGEPDADLAGKIADRDVPYLEIIEDESVDFYLRMAIASSLLKPVYSPRSDALARAGVELLIEAYDNGHRLTSFQERDLVRAAHPRLMLEDDAALGKRYLEAWKKRYLQGIESTHRYELILRNVQLALTLGEPKVADRLLEGWPEAATNPSAFIALINGGAVDSARKLLEENLERYAYPALEVELGPDFARHSTEFLASLAEAETEAAGSTTARPYSTKALAIQAAALMHVAPGGLDQPEAEAAGKAIARTIAEAYRNSDSPPAPVYHALLLMTSLERLPGELNEPLLAWFRQLDVARLFSEGGDNHSMAILRAIDHVVGYELSMGGGGRNPAAVRDIVSAASSMQKPRLYEAGRRDFYQKVLKRSIGQFRYSQTRREPLDPALLDDWIGLFRTLCEVPTTHWDAKGRGDDFAYYIIASALAGKGGEINAWWVTQTFEHRTFLAEAVSSGLWEGFAQAGRFARDVPTLHQDEAARKRFAIETLKAPQPREFQDFSAPWVRRGMATREELDRWTSDLVAEAPRNGFTAYFLARMNRVHLKDPETALGLVDVALGTHGVQQGNLYRFGIERAAILADLGRREEARAELETIVNAPDIPTFLKNSGERLLGQWKSPDAP